MRIKFLGAHKLESQESRHASLLIDDVLAIDAGALTSSLTFAAQQKLRAILLTHQHYDHVRDIPAIGMNFFLHENTIEVYSIQAVYETLSAYLCHDSLYPNFMERPPEKPAIHFKIIEPKKMETIAGYSVLAVPVKHAVPTVGYQVTSTDGKSFFYTSDTGGDLAECWRQVSPDLLIIEVTVSNRHEDFAHRDGHLTPNQLHQELACFRELKGYLPQIVLVHMNPMEEKTIKAEIGAVAKSLDVQIRLGYEGMLIDL